MNRQEAEKAIRDNFRTASQHFHDLTELPVGVRIGPIGRRCCEDAVKVLRSVVDLAAPFTSTGEFPLPLYLQTFPDGLEARQGAYMWAHVAEWCCEQAGIEISSEVPKHSMMPRPDWLK